MGRDLVLRPWFQTAQFRNWLVRLTGLRDPTLNRIGDSVLVHERGYDWQPSGHLLDCRHGQQEHDQYEQELEKRLNGFAVFFMRQLFDLLSDSLKVVFFRR